MAKTVSNVTKYDPDVIYKVKLSTILRNIKWNSRTADATENDDTGDVGFANLVRAIARQGQLTEVVARPLMPATAGKTLELASGFQRCKVLQLLAEQDESVKSIVCDGDDSDTLSEEEFRAWASPDPIVKVKIRAMNDFEFRAENVGENTNRNQLSTADLAFALQDLMLLNPKASDLVLSQILNKNQTYVSKLKRIVNRLRKIKVPPETFAIPANRSKEISALEAWRVTPVNVGPNAIERLCSEEDDTKLAASYVQLIKGKPADEEKKPLRGKGVWAENAKKNITQMALMFAELTKAEIISYSPELFTSATVPLILNAALSSRPASLSNSMPVVKASKGVTLDQAQAERTKDIADLAAFGQAEYETAIKGRRKGKASPAAAE